MEQHTLTLRFDGQEHQVDVQTFAYSVLNFATVVKETNRKLDGSILDINIRAPEKGSLIVNLITTASTTTQTLLDGHAMAYAADLVTTVGGLYGLHKFINGRKGPNVTRVDQSVKIQLEDGATMTVAENVYNIYVQTPAIPTAISQNFSALCEDPAVASFQVSEAGKEIISVDKSDFDRLAIKEQMEMDNTRKIIEAADLHIYKVVFEKTDRKWEFYYRGNKISASIADEDFYKKIDAGEAFSKGDQLKVELQVTQILDESIGTFVNHSYRVMKVTEHIKRAENTQLPFNTSL